MPLSPCSYYWGILPQKAGKGQCWGQPGSDSALAVTRSKPRNARLADESPATTRDTSLAMGISTSYFFASAITGLAENFVTDGYLPLAPFLIPGHLVGRLLSLQGFISCATLVVVGPIVDRVGAAECCFTQSAYKWSALP